MGMSAYLGIIQAFPQILPDEHSPSFPPGNHIVVDQVVLAPAGDRDRGPHSRLRESIDHRVPGSPATFAFY